MCRLVAYLGPPVTLQALLVDPPHGLSHQAWAPERQVSGTVNADGFGVGWYDLDRRPEPGVHRTTSPMWADRSFASFGGIVATTAALALVRGATAPAPTEASGTPPFTDGRWLFGHNGAVEGFRDGVGAQLRRLLTLEQESAILGAADSEVLFRLTLSRLDAGDSPAAALAAVVRTVESVSGGRLNLALTDGVHLAASRVGDSLWCMADGRRTIIASEPFDDEPFDDEPFDDEPFDDEPFDDEPFDEQPGWTEVPDRSVVTATAGDLTVAPLATPSP